MINTVGCQETYLEMSTSVWSLMSWSKAWQPALTLEWGPVAAECTWWPNSIDLRK